MTRPPANWSGWWRKRAPAVCKSKWQTSPERRRHSRTEHTQAETLVSSQTPGPALRIG
jgi:hypothetical protein